MWDIHRKRVDQGLGGTYQTSGLYYDDRKVLQRKGKHLIPISLDEMYMNISKEFKDEHPTM